MIGKWMYTLVSLLLVVSPVCAAENSLPFPPHEFFSKLSETTIPPGMSCCNELRRILIESVTISPRLAAALYQQGKLVLADTRLRENYERAHVLGAISLPYDKVDFMKLKPLRIPIALYWNWGAPTNSSRAALTLYKRGFKHVVLIQGRGTEVLPEAGLLMWDAERGVIMPTE